jgi:hypothetical protein
MRAPAACIVQCCKTRVRTRAGAQDTWSSLHPGGRESTRFDGHAVLGWTQKTKEHAARGTRKSTWPDPLQMQHQLCTVWYWSTCQPLEVFLQKTRAPGLEVVLQYCNIAIACSPVALAYEHSCTYHVEKVGQRIGRSGAGRAWDLCLFWFSPSASSVTQGYCAHVCLLATLLHKLCCMARLRLGITQLLGRVLNKLMNKLMSPRADEPEGRRRSCGTAARAHPCLACTTRCLCVVWHCDRLVGTAPSLQSSEAMRSGAG